MTMALVFAIVILLLASLALSLFLWRTLQAERARSDARVAAVRASIEAGVVRVDAAPTPVAVDGLFEQPAPEQRPRTPLVAVAAVGAFAIAVAAVIGLTGAPRARTEQRGPAAQIAAPAPLELTAMHHERSGESLRVSGFVRNPRRGTTTNGLIAVVAAFDRNGTFLANGRAAVDFLSLEPGIETPFTVSIPNAGDVGRYRVSFRTDAGVVRHVDKRAGQAPLAAHLR